jgi:hypothetical protein
MHRLRVAISLSTLTFSLLGCGDDTTEGSGGSGGSPATSTTSATTTSTATTGATGTGGEAQGTGGAGGGGAGTGGSAEGGAGVGGTGTGGGAEACVDHPIASVEDAVEVPGHPCGPWLEGVRGRVGAQSNGSFVIWSRRTTSGLGLVVSATHTLGPGWFGTPNTAVEEAVVAPADEGVLRLFVPDPAGATRTEDISPLYDHFHLAIPAEENGNLSNILPRHDAFLGLVDRQRYPLEDGGAFPSPGPLEEGLLPLHDPHARTLEAPTFAEPVAGEQVLLVGFPAGGFSKGAFSVGPVLDDLEAEAAIAELAAVDDEEGFIAYEPEVELLVRATSLAGMSGGGAFDGEGRLLGTLVRASQTPEVPQIVRLVRMSWIDARYRAALDAADEDTLAAVARFVEGEDPPR